MNIGIIEIPDRISFSASDNRVIEREQWWVSNTELSYNKDKKQRMRKIRGKEMNTIG